MSWPGQVLTRYVWTRDKYICLSGKLQLGEAEPQPSYPGGKPESGREREAHGQGEGRAGPYPHLDQDLRNSECSVTGQ